MLEQGKVDDSVLCCQKVQNQRLLDMDGYSTVRKRRLQSKSLSPSASLKRAWQEDNIRLRTVVFKEIRKAGISEYTKQS